MDAVQIYTLKNVKKMMTINQAKMPRFLFVLQKEVGERSDLGSC